MKTYLIGSAAVLAVGVIPTAAAGHDTDAILKHLWALEQLQNDRANGTAPQGEDGPMVASDVVMVMAQGEPMTGMPANMQQAMANPGFTIHTTPIRGWVSDDGNMAVTIANTDVTVVGEDGTANRQLGTREFVWHKGDDGNWTILSVFNAGNRPPPE